MTPAVPPRPLRILTVWTDEATHHMEAGLTALQRAGALRLDNGAAHNLAVMMQPDRFDVLVVPGGTFSTLKPNVRSRCAERVRLLVLTPDEANSPPDAGDLATPALLLLDGLPLEVVPAYLVHLFTALVDGDPVMTAAYIAHRQLASNWPEPILRISSNDGDIWLPVPSPRPQTPRLDGAGSGIGNVNFFGEATIGTFMNGPIGSIMVGSQQTQLDETRPSTRDPIEQTRLNNLNNFMQSYCTLEDLETLCFYLGLNADDFGHVGRRVLAQRLVIKMSNRGRLDDLTAHLARINPERAGELPGSS